MSLLLFAGAVGLAACGDDDPDVVIPEPSITITNVVPTQTTISFSLNPKDAEYYKYACVEAGQEPTYTEVKSAEAQDFKAENLKENTAYQIVAIAYNKTKESPKVTKDTKTLEKNVEVATVSIGTITADVTSASIVITPSANATSMRYAVYLATGEVTDSDWVTVTDFNANNTYEVTGLTPNTVYKVEAYALLNDAEGVHVSKDFTTKEEEKPVVNDKVSLAITEVTAADAHVTASLTAEATEAGYVGMFIGRSTKEEYNAETIIAVVNDGRTNMAFKKPNYDGKFSDLFDQASSKPAVEADMDYIVWVIPTTGATEATVEDIQIKEFKMAPGGVKVENISLAVTDITATDAHVSAALTAEAAEAGYEGIFIGRTLKDDYDAETIVAIVSTPMGLSAFKHESFDGDLSQLYDNFGEKPAVASETDYIVWVIPAKEGEEITVDAIVTKEFKTPAVSDDDFNPLALIEKEGIIIKSITETNAGLSLALNEQGDGMFFGVEPAATYSAEEIIAKITGPNANDYKINTWSVNKTLSDYYPNAQAGTSYTVWVIPWNLEGKYSKDPAKIVTKSFTTLKFTYDGINQVTGKVLVVSEKVIKVLWTPGVNTFQFKHAILTKAEAAKYTDSELAKIVVNQNISAHPSESEVQYDKLTGGTDYVVCAVGFDKIGGGEDGAHTRVGAVTRIDVRTEAATGTSNASVTIANTVNAPNNLKFSITPGNGCTKARVLFLTNNQFKSYPYWGGADAVEKVLIENTATQTVVMPIDGVTEFVSSYQLKSNTMYHLFVLPLDNNNGAGPMVSMQDVETATNFVLTEGAPKVKVEILSQDFEYTYDARDPNAIKGTVTLMVKYTPEPGVKRYYTGKVATSDFNSAIKKNTVCNNIITSTTPDVAYIVGENGADAPEVTRTFSYFELRYVPTNKLTIAVLAQNAADEFSKLSGAEVVYPEYSVE